VVEHGVVARVVVWVGQEPLAGLGGFMGFDGLGHDRVVWLCAQGGPTPGHNPCPAEYSMPRAVFNRIV